MADNSVNSPGTPQDVIAGLHELTRRVRAAQRGTWFPLLLFGVLTLGGILVDRITFSVRTGVPCPAGPGRACTVVKHGSLVYWTLGIVVVYAATALFYIRSSRRRGVATPVRPYILAGIVLVGIVAATGWWGVRHATPGTPIDFWSLHLDPASRWTRLLQRFTGAAASVGVPLLVLSWVERSGALLLFTAAYLVLELQPIGTGWAGIAATSPWSGVYYLAIPGVFLLLGALGFALTQPPIRRTLS